MTRIEHIALWAADIELLCNFYVSSFDAQVGPLYENKSKGFASRFLSFGSGARIEVMSTTSIHLVSSEPSAQRMGLTHFAISLGSKSAVVQLTEKLRSTGTTVLDGPRLTGDGYYESVVLDPEGNRIEITA